MLKLLPNGLDFVLETLSAIYREFISLRRRISVLIIVDEFAITGASIVQSITDDAAEDISIKILKHGATGLLNADAYGIYIWL